MSTPSKESLEAVARCREEISKLGLVPERSVVDRLIAEHFDAFAAESVREAVEAEREACAKIADEYERLALADWRSTYRAVHVSQAIRARGGAK